MFPDHIDPVEAKIIDALITTVLNRGHVISVFDGEEWAVKRSNDRTVIDPEIAATCDTQLVVRDAEGTRLGWFWLIHGNRAHVVSDFSDNHLCDEIWNEIQPVIEKWEA